MAGKRYKGKACAYCRRPGVSTTNDHVIARAFFLEGNRDALPQVPACVNCNNKKSLLENYVAAALMIGSNHPEAQRYRRERVRPRLLKNAKLREELQLYAPFEWVRVDGVLQRMKPVRIDAGRITELVRLIVLGLYHRHFGGPLASEFLVDANMYSPEHEAALMADFAPFFPAGTIHYTVDLGRGGFVYTATQSPYNAGLTLWQLMWHGGIPLYGQGGEGTNRWWAITRPTSAAVAAEQERLGIPASPPGL